MNTVCKVQPAWLSKTQVNSIAHRAAVPKDAGIPNGVTLMIQLRGMVPDKLKGGTPTVGRLEVLPALQVWEQGPAATRDAMRQSALRLVDELVDYLRANNYWPKGRT